ncbi:hypothetical protein [Marinomonas shanghaiensis]|uniref:hypothetical protein n=1 Tax=Marinomonas shanghaiensis TaxID=2202418 RepID=UPI0018E58FE8|nr:hypothetical protein [Marinomonas shanghaiensis]
MKLKLKNRGRSSGIRCEITNKVVKKADKVWDEYSVSELDDMMLERSLCSYATSTSHSFG